MCQYNCRFVALWNLLMTNCRAINSSHIVFCFFYYAFNKSWKKDYIQMYLFSKKKKKKKLYHFTSNVSTFSPGRWNYSQHPHRHLRVNLLMFTNNNCHSWSARKFKHLTFKYRQGYLRKSPSYLCQNIVINQCVFW